MPRRCLLTSDTAPPAAMAAGTGTTDADAPPPPSPHLLQWSLHGPAGKVAIACNVIVVVLFFVVIVWRLFFAGRSQDSAAVSPPQQGADGGAAAASASSSGASTPRASPRTRGLRKEDLLALPVFVMQQGASADEEELGGGGRRKQVECAVCISELKDGDTGRLLPRCGHQFHAECVDRWFQSHATCPLCRAVVADGGSGKHDSKAASVV